MDQKLSSVIHSKQDTEKQLNGSLSGNKMVMATSNSSSSALENLELGEGRMVVSYRNLSLDSKTIALNSKDSYDVEMTQKSIDPSKNYILSYDVNMMDRAMRRTTRKKMVGNPRIKRVAESAIRTQQIMTSSPMLLGNLCGNPLAAFMAYPLTNGFT